MGEDSDGEYTSLNWSERLKKEQPITFQQFAERYEWPSEAGLRMYYHKREEYYLRDAFIKFGGRVLVFPQTFFNLILKYGTRD